MYAKSQRFQSHMDVPQSNYLKDFLDILFKRKNILLIFFIATLLTTVIGAVFFQEVQYQASAKILIETNRGFASEPSLPTNNPRRSIVGLNLTQQVDLAIQVLRDHSLAAKVVEKIGPTKIYPDIVKTSKKNIVLSALGLRAPGDDTKIPVKEIAALRLQSELIVHLTGKQSSVLSISFRHKNAELAAIVVNTVIELYFDRHLGLRKKPQLHRFFQEQFSIKKAELKAAESLIQEFKEKYTLSSSPNEAISILLLQRKKNQSELDDTISKEAELSNSVRLLRYQVTDAFDNKNLSMINSLKDKLVKLQISEVELSIRYKDDSRPLKNLRSEIQQIKETLTEYGYDNQHQTGIFDNSSSLYASLRINLLDSERKLNSLIARREAIIAQIEAYNSQIKMLDSLEAEFNYLDEDLSMARESYKLYQTKFEEFRISDKLDAEGIANINVLESARIPLNPVPTKTTLILLLGNFFGIVGGIGLALSLELFAGVLKKREDTEQYLKYPVLATIPEYFSIQETNDGIGSSAL